jgi:hypothetical protein
MNGVNFFTWIREGVRQSVLLGVSDAVEQLGTPASADEIHPSVAGILAAKHTPTPIARAAAEAISTGSGSRKRLGRSLKEMNPPPSEQK